MKFEEQERKVSALVEERFPGWTEEVATIAHQIARERDEPISSDAVIDELLERFPLDLTRKLESGELCVQQDEANRDQIRRWLEDAQGYYDELLERHHREIDHLYYKLREPWREARRAKAAEKDEMIFRTWPESVPDWEEWLNMPVWSLDEALALSFGINPHAMAKDGTARFSPPSLFFHQYKARQDLIERGRQASELPEMAAPLQFRDWALRRVSDLNPEFKEKTNPSDNKEEIGGKEKTSVYGMLLGIAIMNYDFDPNTAFSEDNTEGSWASKNIADDLSGTGVGVSKKTADKYLRRAAEHFKFHHSAHPKRPRDARPYRRK